MVFPASRLEERTDLDVEFFVWDMGVQPFKSSGPHWPTKICRWPHMVCIFGYQFNLHYFEVIKITFIVGFVYLLSGLTKVVGNT